jgi:uncharacterized radical SAM protein YgiQ
MQAENRPRSILYGHPVTDWLPTSRKEADLRGWDELDVVLFTGDAYVDHPSFGAAVIGRTIESFGLRIAIVPQPNWRDDLRDFKKFGRPRLFFGVTSGNMDSMVNHYTANIRLRSDDTFTPGGKAGFRPDYAATVYCKILKQLYPDVPVILGGIEASLRRLSHYDYWSDKLKPGILADCGADLLVYGMGEKPLNEILSLFIKGVPLSSMKNIHQTAFLSTETENILKIEDWQETEIASHEQCLKDKAVFSKSFRVIEEESNKIRAKRIIQKVGKNKIVVNPPFPYMSSQELDHSFDLPYTRLPHPRYDGKGDIPAFEMIKFSVNIHRGCFGGCSFCTISAHQGKQIVSRSEKSIMAEIDKVAKMPGFKGHLSDIGGPSANMYRLQGKDMAICEKCARASCIFPTICKNLETNLSPLLDIYRKVRQHPDVKMATIGSGIRYDIFFKDGKIADDNKKQYIRELIKHHVSGRLKVAPEHTSDEVLAQMRKPSYDLFKKFVTIFNELNKSMNLNQEIIPYFISSHPGCENADMAKLAADTKSLNFKLEQVQDFTPTPLTLSSVIYYSGIHPYTEKKMYTAKTKTEKLAQRSFFFWYKREYQKQIRDELEKIHRYDLIDKLFGSKPVAKGKNPVKKKRR